MTYGVLTLIDCFDPIKTRLSAAGGSGFGVTMGANA